MTVEVVLFRDGVLERWYPETFNNLGAALTASVDMLRRRGESYEAAAVRADDSREIARVTYEGGTPAIRVHPGMWP